MIDKLLSKTIRWLVTLYYKRTHFLTFCWGIDELNGIDILSEEVCDGYTRHGTRDIPWTHQEEGDRNDRAMAH